MERKICEKFIASLFENESTLVKCIETYMMLGNDTRIFKLDYMYDTNGILAIDSVSGETPYPTFSIDMKDNLLMIWVEDASDGVLKENSVICEATIAFVSTDNVRKYMERKGWTSDKLALKEQRLLSKGIYHFKDNPNGELAGSLIKHGMKFYLNSHNTISVLLPMSVYKEFEDTIVLEYKKTEQN